jgi:hypothetical protein
MEPIAKFYISCSSISLEKMQHSTGWTVHMHHYNNAIQANKSPKQDKAYEYLPIHTWPKQP